MGLFEAVEESGNAKKRRRAILAIVAVTIILVIGIKESANFNSAIVIVKVAIVLMFIGIAGQYALQHPDLVRANWPVAPEATR